MELFYSIFTLFQIQLLLCSAKLEFSDEFTKHAIVEPTIYNGRENRQIKTTKDQNGLHIHNVTIGYEIDGRDYLLDLELNRDLVSSNFFIQHQLKNQTVVKRPASKNLEHCQYFGQLRNVKLSWAAISTCRGLRGVIFDGIQMHYIQPESGSEMQNRHIVYKDNDLISNYTCGVNKVNIDEIWENEKYNKNGLKFKRSIDSSVRGPYRGNQESRFIEILIVVDNEVYEIMGSSLKNVYQESKDIVNIINSLYSPLNIFIVLSGIVVWTERNEITLTSEGDKLLQNFLNYRRSEFKNHPNDYAQFLTFQEFEDGVHGKALVGTMCTSDYSGGVNTYVSLTIGLIAKNVAHLIGHNLGMKHDDENCVCPDEKCIMSSVFTDFSSTHWSSCSVKDLESAYEHGRHHCLKNKPKKLFNSPICGNGFLEQGEECDCGMLKNCQGNYCCNPTTCKLYRNATCATGDCCDLNTCNLIASGTLCRSAQQECDLPEYCTGNSEFCPNDIFKMNTEKCGEGKACCYNGYCKSRSDQCRLLWGSTGENSNKECYKLNKKGSRMGNCGYNGIDQIFSACQDRDILCGRLHCSHSNDRLEYGLESTAILSRSYINQNGSIYPCNTAIISLSENEVDPGLVPNGVECGEGRICVNAKCKALSFLREKIKKAPSSICPSLCSNNGICNSLGHCHCNDGFAPPLCDSPGLGGSQDSGPASSPTMMLTNNANNQTH